MTRARPGTQDSVLDAAMHLVAERGLQALTHRGVETRAGVSHGVTTYYFRNRDEMIRALFEHISSRQIAWITQLYATLEADQAQALATGDGPDREAYVRRAVELLLAERTLTLARYELYLHAARDPDFRRFTAELRHRHVTVQAQTFRAAGAADPDFAASRFLSAIEGLLLYQLSVPEADIERWAARYLVAIAELLIPLRRHE